MNSIVLRQKKIQTVVIALFLSGVFILLTPYAIFAWRGAGNAAVRRLYRDWPSAESRYFHIRFSEADRELSSWLALEADRAASRLAGELPLAGGSSKPWLVIIPDQETMRSAFGWGEGTGALGVYLADTIKILSPREWTWEEEEERLAVFAAEGPFVHEYVHYLLDARAGAKYPRWFSEGLAQLMEYRLNGYEWLEDDSPLWQTYNSLPELERFFDTPDGQARAYRQALSLVTFLEEQQGMDGIVGLVKALETTSFEKAFSEIYGQSPESLLVQWRDWFRRDPRWFLQKEGNKA